MRTKRKAAVDPMQEGEFLVRGTQDPLKALEWVVDEMDEHDTHDLLYGVSPHPHYWPTDPEHIQAVADWCHGMLSRARPGIYRKNPVAPDSYYREHEGWTWQIGYADKTGHGAFEGVYFRQW